KPPPPDGRGSSLVASDGGIFAFGDAAFHGSMGAARLAKPVVGMAPTPDGRGYWLVASDGGIFAFGDAAFRGSTGAMHLNAPVVGMAPTPGGGGYWLVGSDGGIFAFGNAAFRGSASGYVPQGEWIAAMAEGPGSGSGSSEAGDFSTPVSTGTGPPYGHASTGYDISWPQCGGSYPPSAPVAVVGVNGGSAFTTNPCFGSEAAWGGPNLTVYLNLNSPQGSDSSQWGQGPAGACVMGDLQCESYNYGYNTARNSLSTAQSAGHGTRTWWLDVETGNYWTSDTSANDQVISGAIAAIHGAGYAAAIYSTNYQWGQIAGSYVPSVPVWYPTGQATSSPSAWCSGSSFAGGPVYLVQEAAGSYDGDYAC
ncbi:MAG: glycoside hydrolase family 25 domain-containing protein, partial [Acidimicrobiales bacterium]